MVTKTVRQLIREKSAWGKLVFVLSLSASFLSVGCNNGGGGSTASTPLSANQQPNPYVALAPYGTWEVVGQERYFVPNQSYLAQYPNWQPYENGYWSYDPVLGWSFVSSDRWGWLTEHYGIWRHHSQWGWIWLPFTVMHYEPSCVTWFDQGAYVGWYPFAERFSTLYVNGFGFDDGYWGGYRSVLSLGGRGNGFFLGITLVNRTEVTETNIYRYANVIRDPSVIARVAVAAHSEENIRAGLVGPNPGGHLNGSYDYIQKGAPAHQAPVGRAESSTMKGEGGQFMHPATSSKTPGQRPGPETGQPHQGQEQGSGHGGQGELGHGDGGLGHNGQGNPPEGESGRTSPRPGRNGNGHRPSPTTALGQSGNPDRPRIPTRTRSSLNPTASVSDSSKD